MASKVDKEMLKKQHFWLLLIPVVIGLLLAWIGVLGVVDGATEEKKAANDSAKAEIDRANAQSREVLTLYDARKGSLSNLRTQRWKEMWDIQKPVYEWPSSLGEDRVALVKDLKFGTEISDSKFLDAFRDYFDKGYEKMVDNAAPIQFQGGWQAVLRHVAKWTKNPESEDVWLAAEDYWVEREMLRSLNEVNKEAAKLKPRTPEKDGLRKRSFAGRTWELNLEMVDKSNGIAIQGTIRNLTPRLQPFNMTNELLFKIWLSDDPAARPFLFSVEGASMEGGKTEPIKFIEKKHIVLEGNPRGLYRVEQVFDVRTAPVKRLDQLFIGTYSDSGPGAVDSRHSKAELQMPAFSEKAVAAEAANPGNTGSSYPMGPSGPPPGMITGVGVGPGGKGGYGSNSGQAATDMTYNGLVRRRYISRTDQVPRHAN